MRNEKILVVDDDPAIRRLIWKSLQSTGILIYQSDSIEKTIDIMSRVAFDLFLLDISLEYENDGY
ncbi:MAG: response regulator, partial [Enterococcus sp.]